MVTGTVIYPLIRRLLPLHTTLNRNYGPFPSWARSHHRLCKLRSRIPGKGLPHGIQTLQIDFCGRLSLCEIPPVFEDDVWPTWTIKRLAASSRICFAAEEPLFRSPVDYRLWSSKVAYGHDTYPTVS